MTSPNPMSPTPYPRTVDTAHLFHVASTTSPRLVVVPSYEPKVRGRHRIGAHDHSVHVAQIEGIALRPQLSWIDRTFPKAPVSR